MKRDVSRIKSCSAPSLWPAAPIKIVNEEELRGQAKSGTEERRKGGAAWPNNHHLLLQKEARQLGRDNATTGRAIYKAFMGDETIFMLS